MNRTVQIQNVGVTYQADHAQANGSVSSSALDHVYSSETIQALINVKKLPNSATDHLPVISAYSLDKNKVIFKHSITKRSFKDFTKENWNESLARQNFKVKIFTTKLINYMTNAKIWHQKSFNSVIHFIIVTCTS